MSIVTAHKKKESYFYFQYEENAGEKMQEN